MATTKEFCPCFLHYSNAQNDAKIIKSVAGKKSAKVRRQLSTAVNHNSS